MNGGFTKLFPELVDSTIWREDMPTKIVWITMLAKASRNGVVSASIPGLADAARVSIPECEAAIHKFMGPDPYSRTKDFEGRRIMETDGGWILLNYLKYRKVQDADEVRESTAARVRKFREKHNVTKVTDVTPTNAIAEAEAEAEADKTKPSPAPKVARKFAWMERHDPQVVEATQQIMQFYPDQSQRQPDGKPIPKSSGPELAERLSRIKKQGASITICIAIAHRYVEEFNKGGKWIKAAQNFFGLAEDAPFKAYYQAHLTNEEVADAS